MGSYAVILGKLILKCIHKNFSKSITISSKLKFHLYCFIYRKKYPEVSTNIAVHTADALPQKLPHTSQMHSKGFCSCEKYSYRYC